ncbi:MAG: DUF4406 domain-containing protein [Patescibacteria group bacterium]
MVSIIYNSIKHSTSLEHVHEGLIKVIKKISESSVNQRIGFVAGIISSDGDENMPNNIEKLRQYTEKLRKKYNFPIFSSVDVFSNGLYDQMEEVEFERELREHHFVQFWKMILKSGHITDIFMTPRWEMSRGAKVEYITAKKLKIKIHFVKEI